MRALKGGRSELRPTLEFAGLRGECWIPVPLPPPAPSSKRFVTGPAPCDRLGHQINRDFLKRHKARGDLIFESSIAFHAAHRTVRTSAASNRRRNRGYAERSPERCADARVTTQSLRLDRLGQGEVAARRRTVWSPRGKHEQIMLQAAWIVPMACTPWPACGPPQHRTC
jgi:hypothetical protein